MNVTINVDGVSYKALPTDHGNCTGCSIKGTNADYIMCGKLCEQFDCSEYNVIFHKIEDTPMKHVIPTPKFNIGDKVTFTNGSSTGHSAIEKVRLDVSNSGTSISYDIGEVCWFNESALSAYIEPPKKVVVEFDKKLFDHLYAVFSETDSCGWDKFCRSLPVDMFAENFAFKAYHALKNGVEKE